MSSTDVDTLQRTARLAGFDFSAADLQALLPAIERMLQALERLETLPLGPIEPVTQFRLV